ncbi:MAG: hypothetical protein SVZ03_10355 [Spirochaetota bacterium]|nr:hypothetical protein [Spirochaetota bacterium]
MKIVYYTSGLTGWGRVVIGISIGNALKRRGIADEYTILSNSSPPFIADYYRHIEIPLEDEEALSEKNCHTSILYRTMMEINPDVMLFDLIWFTTYHFIREFPCKKIFLCHQVSDVFFSMHLPDKELIFNPAHYDRVLAIEPFMSAIKMDSINPIVIRNREEILTKRDALERLNITGDEKVCLFSFNSDTDEFDRIKEKYSYLKDYYKMIYTFDYTDGLFPEVDYFNAIDFIICGGGYNQFWEAVYFNKEAVFEAVPLVFESHSRRIRECQEYYFEENGADQLVEIIVNL